MANRIQEMIEKFEGGEDRSEAMEALIRMLKAKQEELGDDISDEEADRVIKECLMAQLSGVQSSSDAGDSSLSPEDRACMMAGIAAVKEVFEEEGWRYRENMTRHDVMRFDLGFSMDNCSIKMKVNVEADPNVCRIEAILPITADEIYDYVLCKAIAKENYPRRYGALQYDESDGEVSYRYSYPIGNGLFKDDFKRIFLAVANSADDSYEIIRKCCVGKFKSKEKQEILEKVGRLVDDISE